MHRLTSREREVRDGICQESESRGILEQADKGAYNREILSCGKQRSGVSEQIRKKLIKKIIMIWHGILSQIISSSTSLPIHLKSQAKRQAGKKQSLQYRIISNECNKTEFDIKLSPEGTIRYVCSLQILAIH